MFGRKPTSAMHRPERNVTYGHPPATESTDRGYTPDRRQLRGQLDLVQEVLRESPWYY